MSKINELKKFGILLNDHTLSLFLTEVECA